MGILVICSYRPNPGREDEARMLVAGHVPLLREHGLITSRPAIQGVTGDGELVEIFEWQSVEKSSGAAAIAEIGEHWKAMGEVMEFVPMAQLAECQHAFAHFMPV
jgi:hypothetical protein